MKVTEEAIIFKNDLGFSTSISNKKQDGTYENMYISVQFPKNDERAQEMPNKTKIYITNAFLSFYKSTAGQPKVKLVVRDYKILTEEKPAEKPMQESDDLFDDRFDDMVTNINEYGDDLPF